MELKQWIYVETLYTDSGHERMIIDNPIGIRTNKTSKYLKQLISLVKFLFL